MYSLKKILLNLESLTEVNSKKKKLFFYYLQVRTMLNIII